MIEVTKEELIRSWYELLASNRMAATLDKLADFVVEKNKQYGGAWEVDGLITSFADMKDKMYRTAVLTDIRGGIEGQVVRFGSRDFSGNTDDNYNGDKIDDLLVDVMARAALAHLKYEEMKDKAKVKKNTPTNLV